MKYYTRGVRRRGDTDQWEVRLMHKDPVTQEEIFEYRTVTAKTKKQAERKRDELVFEMERQGGAMHSKLTVAEFLTSFVDYKEKCGIVEPSTIKGYRYEARQISHYIGNELLCELSIATINDWMAQMTEDGYASKTVAKPFRLLKQALNFAIAHDLLTKNPCNFCKPPKRTKTKINALPREEHSRMLEMARNAMPEPLAIAVELALTTGMRRGEVCALRWSDLRDDGSITVRRALGYAEGGFYEKDPKTFTSDRTIPLTRYTFMMLSAIKEDAYRLLTRLGVPNADPYILGTQELESRPYNPTLLGKDFAAFCKMNGFHCTFHDLRHTFATFMIGAGVDVRTVASYLGHSSVSMTLDVYADVDPDAKFGAVSKIEQAFDSERNDALGLLAESRGFDPAGEYDTDEVPGAHPEAMRHRAGFKAGMGNFTLSAQNIPFTEEELEDMLATIRASKQKRAFSA